MCRLLGRYSSSTNQDKGHTCRVHSEHGVNDTDTSQHLVLPKVHDLGNSRPIGLLPSDEEPPITKGLVRGDFAPPARRLPLGVELAPVERIRLITDFAEHRAVVNDKRLADEDGGELLDLGCRSCLGRGGGLLLPIARLLAAHEEKDEERVCEENKFVHWSVSSKDLIYNDTAKVANKVTP